jgi:hypothetical protein
MSKEALHTMKQYLSNQKLILAGKAWEIRHHLEQIRRAEATRELQLTKALQTRATGNVLPFPTVKLTDYLASVPH